MLTEKELIMYNAQGKEIRAMCKDGTIVEGRCELFTQPIDNEPEVAEISIQKGKTLIGITEPEIEKIEYIK